MNIAIFTNNYLPFVGGVPISIERLANSLRDLNHKVYIFAPSYDNYTDNDEYIIRCSSLSLDFIKDKIYKGSPSTEFKITIPNILDKQIEEKFNSLNIDVVHVHHPFLIGSLGVHLANKNNLPCVFTYHTMFDKYLHNIKLYKHLYNSKTKLSKMITDFTENNVIPNYLKSFCNKCSMVIAPTTCAKNYLDKLNIDTEIVVHPTGLTDDSFLHDKTLVDEIAYKYKKDKKYLFCTVSRLSKEKNIEFMIDALAILKTKIGNNFRFIIIGDGPLRENLNSKIKNLKLDENIILVGNVDNKSLSNYYKASDLFLFSSKSETQGIVLLEAMALGLPVVAVEGTGINDLVKDNYNGFKSKDSLIDWSDKILSLLDNSESMSTCINGATSTALSYKQSTLSQSITNDYLLCIQSLNKETDYENEINANLNYNLYTK